MRTCVASSKGGKNKRLRSRYLFLRYGIVQERCGRGGSNNLLVLGVGSVKNRNGTKVVIKYNYKLKNIRKISI